MAIYHEMKNITSLFLFLSFFLIFSTKGISQNQRYSEKNENYWFLQKNDTLLGINLWRLNKYIKTQNIKPKSSLTVAIIDAGFDFNHPDIKNIIWTNIKEKENNQKDDDSNGYIDDLHGWNFLGNKSGENIERVGTAEFRKYKHLRKKYVNADTTKFTPFEKQEYRLYKEMGKKSKIDNYIRFEKKLSALNNMYNICDSLMSICYGTEQTTILDFYKIDVKDTTGIMLPLKTIASKVAMYPKEKLWNEVLELNRSKYELVHKRVKSLDDDTDDPHIKIGNTPDDFHDFQYGNNQIQIDPYHGTMVAGLVGLASNIGMANIKIMGIRSIPEGDEYDKDIVAAIRYAVDNGAKIINMSFGKKYSEYSKEVDKAIKYAKKHDVLIIKSSGNDGLDTDLYPNFPKNTDEQGEYFENFIIVGSSLKDGTLANFSNYGEKTVDVLAPGIQITSTAPNSKYDIEKGTSLSAPIVTGVAAILRSYFPDLTAKQIKEILMKTVTDLSNKKTRLPDKNMPMTTLKSTNRTGGIVNGYDAFKEALKQSNYKL